ncbi:MAG: OmpH family outer membrane protein [Muribaculaceae bacterium]|nr:OmpH family outer membrane protein [Muribaculaceae bacterium]
MNPNRISMLATIVAMILLAVSCNDNQPKPAAPSAGGAAAPIEKMTIRYVDEDSIMANYNLAKDINEAMLRKQNQFDAAQQQRGSDIDKFAKQMETKYKNNGYLTEESFNADQATLAKKQREAESYLGNLQQTMQNELSQSQQQLLDSIDNFMKEYARQKGYDMVIRKSATLYIDPKFDVTEEVIAGLNKRYTKVAKK